MVKHEMSCYNSAHVELFVNALVKRYVNFCFVLTHVLPMCPSFCMALYNQSEFKPCARHIHPIGVALPFKSVLMEH